jgi:chemotaxis signal transduction protein
MSEHRTRGGREIAQPCVTMSAEAQTEFTNPAAVETSSAGQGAAFDENRQGHQYCVFRVGKERYCLDVSEVEEVVEWSRLTRMPLAPAFVMGILNLRGVIIPVLDIAYQEDSRRDRVAHGAKGKDHPTHIVVSVWGKDSDRSLQRVGFAADEMHGTYFTSEALLIEEAPGEVLHCRGMLRHGDRLALALSLDRMHEAFPIPII